jgi:hypothetical protein
LASEIFPGSESKSESLEEKLFLAFNSGMKVKALGKCGIEGIWNDNNEYTIPTTAGNTLSIAMVKRQPRPERVLVCGEVVFTQSLWESLRTMA